MMATSGNVSAPSQNRLLAVLDAEELAQIESFVRGSHGLGFQIRSGNPKTLVDFGSFISAIIYFVIFMAVVYFLIVVPYKMVQARRGQVVFGDPAPVKTCPACLSTDLPAAASKCKYCGTEQPVTT